MKLSEALAKVEEVVPITIENSIVVLPGTGDLRLFLSSESSTSLITIRTLDGSGFEPDRIYFDDTDGLAIFKWNGDKFVDQ